MKTKNYKYLIGLVIGLLLVTSVYGISSILSSNVIYDSDNSSYSTGDVQGAIDTLAEKIDNVRPTTCPDGTYCEPYKYTLEVGDYVYYKPEKKSYQVDTSMTGYTGTVDQTIYPDELTSWIVLNLNDDGTVDLISEYVSSTKVYFNGQTGYLNFIGYLNVLAEQYETTGITAEVNGSRHFGYDGQIEFLEDTDPSTIFVTPAPFTCSTGDSCEPDPDNNEDKGGGDTLYKTDYDRVNTVLGTRKANKVGTVTVTSYWMASRNYNYSSNYWSWENRTVSSSDGSVSSARMGSYFASSSNLGELSSLNAIRPIVTLKSGFQYKGVGSKEAPMKIIID